MELHILAKDLHILAKDLSRFKNYVESNFNFPMQYLPPKELLFFVHSPVEKLKIANFSRDSGAFRYNA